MLNNVIMSDDIPKGKQSLKEILKESIEELKKEGVENFPGVQKLLDSSAKQIHKRVLRKSPRFPKTKKLAKKNSGRYKKKVRS